MLETLLRDFRYAFRTMGRNPGFTIVVVTTMALSIGTATSIFSIADAVLLRPLPYPQPERIVEIGRDQGADAIGALDARTFGALRDGYRAAAHLAAAVGGAGNLRVGDERENVSLLKVTAGYLEVLGVAPALGRGFTQEDEQHGAPLAVILSDALWRGRFGADPRVVGETVRISNELYTVAGVMPEGFRTFPPRDAWVPLRLDFRGAGYNYAAIGRLREGVTRAQAQSELEALLASLRSEGFSWPENQRLIAMGYQSRLALSVKPALVALLGAVAMVLLIACANVAGLLLARAAARQGEIAIRTALGGGRGRIARQLLTESIALGLLGGAAGLLLAYWGVEGLLALSPTDYSDWQVGVDLRVAAAALSASVLTGLLFGFVPAITASRSDVRSALHRAGARGHSGGRSWLRGSLVVAESALCMALLVGAALLTYSFINLRNVELGFDPSNVATARMPIEGEEYKSSRRLSAFYGEALARIQTLPGIEAAAISTSLPVERGLNLPIRVPQGPDEGEITSVDWRYVSPDFFRTMRIPLLRGRSIEPADSLDSAPVVLINQEFADRFFGQIDPVGHSVELHPFTSRIDDQPRQIVGVVGNVKTRGLAAPARPTMFVPIRQVPDGLLAVVHGFHGANWVFRVGPGTSGVMTAIQDAVASIDSRQRMIRVRQMDDVISASLSEQRFRTTVLGVFAFLALLMAVAGIYGLIAYSVRERRREFGIRMALGASARAVVASVVRRGVAMAGAGALAGVGLSLAFARVLQRFAFGVDAADPLLFLVVAILLLGAAALASLVPASALLRLSPAVTLRQE